MKKLPDSLCEEHHFSQIYEENSQRLIHFLYYQFGDLEKAKNFAQDAFIRLWSNCKEIAIEKARAFVYTTAKRLFLDDFAHAKVHLKFQERAKAKEQTAESAEDSLRTQEFKEALEKAISNLPEKQRTAFLMNRIDQMKYTQIAEALGISVKTVEKHMSQALMKVKEELEIYGSFKF